LSIQVELFKAKRVSLDLHENITIWCSYIGKNNQINYVFQITKLQEIAFIQFYAL